MPDIPTPFFFRLMQNHFKLLFWIFFVCAFITGYVQTLQNKKLTNETARKGIISLETACTFQGDTSIISSWKAMIPDDSLSNNCKPKEQENRLALARTNIFIDFFFIFFYTGLAILIICRLQWHAGVKRIIYTRLLILLAIVAGVMDIIENLGMLRFIQFGLTNASVSKTDTIVTSIASHTKFYIVIALALFYLPYMLIFRNHGLKILSTIISTRGQQLFRYRVIFLGVMVFVTPIWILDQGQDLLVNSNAQDIGVISFLATVLVAAFLNWYLAKLFFQEEYKGPVYPFTEPLNQNPAEKKVSRFLGVTTILLPAAAILNALQVTHIGYPLDIFPPVAWLLALLSIFYALIKYDVAGKLFNSLVAIKGKKWATAASFILIGLLVLVIPFVIRTILGENKHQPASLIALYWHILFIAIAFYIFISIRSIVFTNGWLGNNIGKLVFTLTIIACLFFVWINITPKIFVKWDNHFMTLPLLLAGLICYIFLFTLLIRLSKWLKINFVFFILVIGLVFNISSTNNYHQVDMSYYPPRDSSMKLENYFKQWVLSREKEINADSIYPVFLINTYGGGIRASAFTSMVLTYLDSRLIQNGKWKKGFQHYAFSISGASGGTIGAAIQCAYRNRYMDDETAYDLDKFSKFYQHDFLTPVLIPDLGRDVWASSTSVSIWDDRSAVQEKLWTEFGKKYLDLDLGVDFDSIWSLGNKTNNYEVPLLFSNTLNVDDGLKGICAPVALSQNDFPATIFIKDRVDTINAHRNKKDSVQAISLMTGAFLSARFPFISPSGKMGPGFHFMDGGGKDNSGASTSELIFAALGRYVSKQSAKKNLDASDSLFISLAKKIHFYFLSINNSPHKKADPRKLVENRFELISPLIGIINSGIDGNARAADSTLRARYGLDSLRHLGFFTSYLSIYPTADCIKDTAGGDDYVPVLPLGWQISDPALKRLKASFEDDQINNKIQIGIDSILKIMQLEKTLVPVKNK
jgi:hypothetical protein